MSSPGAFSAFTFPFRGLRLITRPGFRRYAAIPLLINAALFAGLGSLLFSQLGGWVDALLPPGGWQDYVRWLVWPVAVLAFLLVGYFMFTLIGNVIAAPFNDVLAARIVAADGEGAAPVKAGRGLSWHDARVSVSDELHKLWYVATRSLPALVLFLIPGANIAAPVVWFLVGSWLLAFEYLDYAFAQTDMRFADQRRLLRRELLTAVGFGAGVSALLLIPGLNLAAIPASVAGACLLWKERWREQGASSGGPGRPGPTA